MESTSDGGGGCCCWSLRHAAVSCRLCVCVPTRHPRVRWLSPRCCPHQTLAPAVPQVLLWSYPDTQRQPIALQTEHQANIVRGRKGWGCCMPPQLGQQPATGGDEQNVVLPGARPTHPPRPPLHFPQFGVRFLPQTGDARLVTGAMDYTVQVIRRVGKPRVCFETWSCWCCACRPEWQLDPAPCLVLPLPASPCVAPLAAAVARCPKRSSCVPSCAACPQPHIPPSLPLCRPPAAAPAGHAARGHAAPAALARRAAAAAQRRRHRRQLADRRLLVPP